MTEYVLAIPRTALEKQSVGTKGIYPLDVNLLDEHDYAFLPRKSSDNKSDASISLGKLFPQILGYFQIQDEQGRILTYRRKGKEKGLLGKYSIGVGGHVDLSDLKSLDTTQEPTTLVELITISSARELYEEMGIDLQVKPTHFQSVISTWEDKTSQVHVGLPTTIRLTKAQISALTFSDAEFPAVEWLTKDELKTKAKTETFEAWSRLLIEQF